MPWLVDSQRLTCLSHFSAPDDRALVRRVVELIEITDVACWSEHHQLLMVLIILSKLCSDSNRSVHLSVFGCNCGRLRSRWSQIVSECVGHTTSCCWCAADTLASCALMRSSSGSESGRPRTQERLQATQLTSASLCLLRESALRNAAFGCQRADCPSPFHLSSACSCASTSCRSSSHCVPWLSESSTSLLSTFASSEHSLSPRSATSWTAFGCCRSCGELLPFRLGLHQSVAVLYPLVHKRLLGQLDWISHLRFRVAVVLAAAYVSTA